MVDLTKKALQIVLSIMLVALVSINSALAQNYDSLTLNYEPVKTKDFRFEPTYYVLPDVAASNKVKPYSYLMKKPAEPLKLDLSFLKNYDYQEYSMGDFVFNNSLINMPFREWGGDEIPYHIKQQTFSVTKPKRKK